MSHSLEQLTPNVTREWLHGGRIVIFSLQGATRHDVDRMFEGITEVVLPWDKSKPLLVMYDVSRSHITPYTRKRTIDVGKAIPLGIHGRTAVLVPSGLLYQVFLMFIHRYLPVRNVAMQRDYFTSREKAITWLEAGLEET